MKTNPFAVPTAPALTITVDCTPEACAILADQGPMAQRLVLSLDDAEGVAKMILEKCAATRSPILVTSNVPGLKS